MKGIEEIIANPGGEFPESSHKIALEHAGIYSEYVPACPICLDFGYIVPNVPTTDPRFGRVVPCTCVEGIKNSRLFLNSGLLPAEQQWDTKYILGIEGVSDDQRLAVRAVRDTAADGKGWVVLYGPYGVGKSGLLKSAVANKIRQGQRAYYRRAEDILREARATFDNQVGATSESVFARYANVPVLSLDEVDRVSMTDWAKSFLFALIDVRYNQRNTTTTLFATNADLKALPASWGYLASRMSDGVIVAMIGKSLRGLD